MLELIDHLPRTSRLAEAIEQDDELAELMADAPVADRSQSAAPRHTEFTREAELLTILANRIGELLEVVTALGGRPARIPALGGPVGAAERLAVRREDEQYDDLLADIETAYVAFQNENPAPN